MREENLSSPDLYSNVRVLSRHALEVEQSLQKGTEKANNLSHLVQPRKQGMLLYICNNLLKKCHRVLHKIWYVPKILFIATSPCACSFQDSVLFHCLQLTTVPALVLLIMVIDLSGVHLVWNHTNERAARVSISNHKDEFRSKLHDPKFNCHFIRSVLKSHNLIAKFPK